MPDFPGCRQLPLPCHDHAAAAVHEVGHRPVVAIDNERAAREATEHLLALGRRRILTVGGRDDGQVGTTQARTRGFRLAPAGAGLAYDPAALPPAAGEVALSRSAGNRGRGHRGWGRPSGR